MQTPNPSTLSKTVMYDLVRRYWLVVTIVFIAGTVGMWAAFPIAFTETYETRARLLVKIGRENAETPATIQRGQVLSQGVRVADINSEVEILSSRALVEAAVDRLGPDAFKSALVEPTNVWGYPKYYAKRTAREAKRLWTEFLIATMLKKRLTDRENTIVTVAKGVTVEPVRDSDILVLKVETPGAQLSVDVANILLEEYLKRRNEIRRNSAGSDFFRQRLKETQHDLTTASGKRAAIRQAFDVNSPSEERSRYLDQLDTVDKEVVSNEAEIARLQRHVEVMTSREKNLPEMVEKEQIEATNPSIASIKERLTTLRVDRAKVAGRYQPGSQMIAKMDGEIQDLEKFLAQEKPTILSSVTTESNPTKRSFDADLEATTVRMEGLRTRNDSLEHSSQELRGRIVQVTKGFDEYEAAEREYKTSEQQYLLYSQRLQEAAMQEELDALRVANVIPVEKPETPLEPAHPNKIFLMEVAMAVSLALGIGLAVLLEVTEDRIFTEKCVLDLGNIPYLGSVDLKKRTA
jgi:uncharacterized protein involved in exopolysaccharide biosynthesis